MANCKSFAPKVTNNTKVLILGSMPGIKSLQMQEYYAHPQNRFWKIMGLLCGYKELEKADYKTKISVINANGIGLWDVIENCSRKGSLDSDIEKEQPNDIRHLLEEYPEIKTICLNGNKSFFCFKKYFPELLMQYRCLKMPSTSPANARYNLNKLFAEWKNLS